VAHPSRLASGRAPAGAQNAAEARPGRGLVPDALEETARPGTPSSPQPIVAHAKQRRSSTASRSLVRSAGANLRAAPAQAGPPKARTAADAVATSLLAAAATATAPAEQVCQKHLPQQPAAQSRPLKEPADPQPSAQEQAQPECPKPPTSAAEPVAFMRLPRV
jgi:hypothetical protein